MGWKATGEPTVRKQRSKWVVRVVGADYDPYVGNGFHTSEEAVYWPWLPDGKTVLAASSDFHSPGLGPRRRPHRDQLPRPTGRSST